MEIRFFIDPDTDETHCLQHQVSPAEASFVLRNSAEDYPARDETRAAIGYTPGGRCLKVIYTEGRGGRYHFVITAYDVTGQELKAFRRRERGRGKR